VDVKTSLNQEKEGVFAFRNLKPTLMMSTLTDIFFSNESSNKHCNMLTNLASI